MPQRVSVPDVRSVEDLVQAALTKGDGNYVGDIITCHLSDGRCDLAVKGLPPNRHRIAPGMGLPG